MRDYILSDLSARRPSGKWSCERERPWPYPHGRLPVPPEYVAPSCASSGLGSSSTLTLVAYSRPRPGPKIRSPCTEGTVPRLPDLGGKARNPLNRSARLQDHDCSRRSLHPHSLRCSTATLRWQTRVVESNTRTGAIKRTDRKKQTVKKADIVGKVRGGVDPLFSPRGSLQSNPGPFSSSARSGLRPSAQKKKTIGLFRKTEKAKGMLFRKTEKAKSRGKTAEEKKRGALRADAQKKKPSPDGTSSARSEFLRTVKKKPTTPASLLVYALRHDFARATPGRARMHDERSPPGRPATQSELRSDR